MTALTIPPLSPFPGRGAAPEDYISQADTVMQQLPRTVAGIQAVSDALNLGAGVLSLGYLPAVAYGAGIAMILATQTVQYGGVTYAPLLEALPFTTSGAFEVAKFRVVQGVTAAELAEPSGAATVGYGDRTIEARLSDQISVLRFGAVGNGVHNELPAVLLAKAYSGRVHFPRVNDGLTTYYIGAFAPGALDGLTMSADDGVALSFSANAPYSLYSAIIFERDLRVYFRDISCWYTFQATPVPTRIAPTLAAPTTRRQRQALDCTKAALVTARENLWNTDDTFAVTAATKTANSISFGTAAQPMFRGAFVELGAYETISALFDEGIVPGPVGVIIRGLLGFTVIYSNGPTGNYFTATKLYGAPADTAQANLGWAQLGQGVYSSFAPDRAVWSISKMSAKKAFIKLNGKALSAPFAQDVGDIHEVGFVCYGAAAFTVSGLTLERRTDAAIGLQELTLRIFGDSTAAPFPSYWGLNLRPLLNSLYGVRVAPIENYAVAGHTLEQQFAIMQTVGLGSAYYVFVCTGTNNIQGATPLSDWAALVTAVLNFIITAGRRPVIMIPWLWYGQAQSGGPGQGSARYNEGAPYRMIMERIAYDLGAVVVKLVEELPNPSPTLLQTDPLAPLLRDDIHQDAVAHTLYAQVASSALTDDYMAMPDSVEEKPTPSMMMNGATAVSDLRFVYGKSGTATLIGTMGVTTITTGTPVMRCPRHIAPSISSNIGATALAADQSVLGSCWLNVEPSQGAITISRAPAGTALIILTGSTWQTAISKM